jgi:hypothetical protein
MARIVLLAAAVLSACSGNVQLPDGALVSCGADGDCPDGYICRATLGRCVRPGGDVTAPELLTSSLVVTPVRVGSNTPSITVEFQVSEGLAADPQAFLSWPGQGSTTRRLSVVSKDEAAHSYVLSYSPAPGSDPEGDVSLDASFIDDAGNQGHAGLPNVAVFDFTAPRLAVDLGGAPVAEVTLTPPATSPLRDVTAVTVGTRLRVGFAANELLAGAGASPRVTLTSGATSVPLTQLSGNGLSYVYETVVAPGLPQGTAALAAHLTDLAGNEADVSLGTVPVVTQRPATPAVNAAGAVVFHRIPWGSEATLGGQAYYLRGLAGSVPAGATAIAYSDPTVVSAGGVLVGREIARATADGSGAFGGDVGDPTPFQLFMGDSPDVYVAAVDAAGNVSDADGDPSNGLQAALVRDVSWTATLQGKIPGRVFPNPHAFEGREVWTPTLAQEGGRPLSTPADVGRQDGARASVRGAPYWLPARRPGQLPYRGGTGMVHDPVRNCRVAYGGVGWDACDSGFYCDQWEACRGGPWFRPQVDDPEGDGNPPLATELPLVFAGGRGATVLATGTDLWEWDGVSWRKLSMTDPEGDGDPSPRTGHAIAYDEARQRLLLFGGRAVAGGASLADLWETDFRSWRQLCTTAPCSATRPVARFGHAMVYDPARKNVLLVGGITATGFDIATWTWDGAAWTSRCTTAPCVTSSPAQRSGHGLAFDTGRDRAVVFGGSGSGGYADGTYEWNGTAWTAACTTAPCSTTRPTPRGHPSLFYDLDRGRTVLYGGEVGFGNPECSSGPFCGTEWEWSGSAWTQVTSAASFPPSVRDVEPVYDPVRDRVVLFGGRNNSGAFTSATWLWDGASWAQASPATVPTARAQYAAAWVATGSSAGHVALFGGVTTGFGLVPAASATYTWNGTNWVLAGTGPAARTETSLAQSTLAAPPGGALLFGGEDSGSSPLCDAWQLSGNSWSSVANCPASGPAARYGAAMVRATGFPGAPVVLFGGAGATEYNDVWTHNGSTWTRLSPGGPQGATQPRTRIRHGLFFDTARDRVTLWGGSPAAAVANVNCVDDYGGLPCHDFWEWSGSAWTRVFPVDLYGDGSPDPASLAGIAFDTSRRRGVGLENTPGTSGTIDTWLWSGGGDDRPGQVASVVFDAAEVTRPFDVLDLEVAWVGGATGAPGGTVTNGASLQVWDNRAWRTLATSNTARPGATESLRWTLSTDATLGTSPVGERQRFMVGDQRLLHLALVPRAVSGSASGLGEVATDYVEVTVRYRLAP